MASVVGGLFNPATSNVPVGGSHTPQDAGRLSLASITALHSTVAGGGGSDTVGGGRGGSDTVGGGFDTVSGPQHADVRFSGHHHAGRGDQVVANQTQEGGNTVIHLPDGSTITLVGTTHVDASFIH